MDCHVLLFANAWLTEQREADATKANEPEDVDEPEPSTSHRSQQVAERVATKVKNG